MNSLDTFQLKYRFTPVSGLPKYLLISSYLHPAFCRSRVYIKQHVVKPSMIMPNDFRCNIKLYLPLLLFLLIYRLSIISSFVSDRGSNLDKIVIFLCYPIRSFQRTWLLADTESILLRINIKYFIVVQILLSFTSHVIYKPIVLFTGEEHQRHYQKTSIGFTVNNSISTFGERFWRNPTTTGSIGGSS